MHTESKIPQGSLKRSTIEALWYLNSEKKISISYCVVLELVPLRGERNFKPRPQNIILVHTCTS